MLTQRQQSLRFHVDVAYLWSHKFGLGSRRFMDVQVRFQIEIMVAVKWLKPPRCDRTFQNGVVQVQSLGLG